MGIASATDCLLLTRTGCITEKGDLLVVKFVQVGVTFVPLIHCGSFVIFGPLLLFRLFVPCLMGT